MASPPNKRMHATADTKDFIISRRAWRRVMRGVRFLGEWWDNAIVYVTAANEVWCVVKSEQVGGVRREIGASHWRKAWRDSNEVAERRMAGGGLKMAQSNKGMHPTRRSSALMMVGCAGG